MKYLAIKFSLKNIVLFDFLRGYRLTTMALLYFGICQFLVNRCQLKLHSVKLLVRYTIVITFVMKAIKFSSY